MNVLSSTLRTWVPAVQVTECELKVSLLQFKNFVIFLQIFKILGKLELPFLRGEEKG